jgi:3-carboxy-cis,cis-muconate cycloisomerase
LSGDLWSHLFGSNDVVAATDGTAWVQAMLEAEAALAAAATDIGIVPAEAAIEIERTCVAFTADPAELGVQARASGNPVIPLVAALRRHLPEPAASWVHWGATSQDILDTAAVLVATRAGRLINGHVDRLAQGCATLAAGHRDTLMLARTLLQPALPTTFGAKAASWLAGVLDARMLLDEATDRLPASLGGAAGTLAAFGDAGPHLVAIFSSRLGLAEPLSPWHTARQRVAALGSALAIVAGTAAKITGDVALLMQAEVAEASDLHSSGSSTLPQKRNPVAASLAQGASRQTAALASVLFGSVAAEHERPVGAWHAEWVPLTDLLVLTGGAAAAAAEMVTGLQVDPIAMRANLDRVGPVLLSERLVLALSPFLGREEAVAAVDDAAAASDFAAALAADPRVGDVLTADELVELLDPAGYVGAAGTWVDRALASFQEVKSCHEEDGPHRKRGPRS